MAKQLNFSRWLNRSHLSDLQFVVGEKTYRCHAVIAHASSSTFRRIIDERRRDHPHEELRIPLTGVAPSEFERTLAAMYLRPQRFQSKSYCGNPALFDCTDAAFLDYIESSLLADVTLLVEGQKIPGHRVMFSARSAYFETLFTGSVASFSGAAFRVEVEVPLPLAVFTPILRFVYGAALSLDSAVAVPLFEAAQQLKMPELARLCEDHLIDSVSVENVCYLWMFADNLAADRLHETCARFFQAQFAAVLRTKHFAIFGNQLLALQKKTGQPLEQVASSSSSSSSSSLRPIAPSTARPPVLSSPHQQATVSVALSAPVQDQPSFLSGLDQFDLDPPTIADDDLPPVVATQELSDWLLGAADDDLSSSSSDVMRSILFADAAPSRAFSAQVHVRQQDQPAQCGDDEPSRTFDLSSASSSSLTGASSSSPLCLSDMELSWQPDVFDIELPEPVCPPVACAPLPGKSSLADILPHLKLLIDLATKNLQGQRGTLLLHDQQSDELCSLVTVGKQEAVIRFDASRGIAGSVFRTGAPVRIPDAYLDPRFLPDVDRRLNFRSKQILCVPVFGASPSSRQAIGCLQVINHVHDSDFTEQDLQSLRLVSELVSSILQNVAQRHSAAALSSTFGFVMKNPLLLVSLRAGDADRHDQTDSRELLIRVDCALADSDDATAALVQEVRARYPGADAWQQPCAAVQFPCLTDDFGKDAVLCNDDDTAASLSAHLLFVCHRFAYLKQLFCAELRAHDRRTCVVLFERLEAPLLTALHRYVYSGAFDFAAAPDERQLLKLLRLALLLGDALLAGQLEQRLCDALAVDNVLRLFLAAQQLALPRLRAAAQHHLASRFRDVCQSEDFRTHGAAVLQHCRVVAPSPAALAERQSDPASDKIRTLLALCDSLFLCDRSTLFLYDAAADELVAPYTTNSNDVIIHIDKRRGIAGRVFTSGALLCVADAYAHPDFEGKVDVETGYRTKSMMCSPVRSASGAMLGVLQVINKTVGDFDHNDIELIGTISVYLAMVLDGMDVEPTQQLKRQRIS